VKSFEHLPASHEKSGLCTSPDGKFIVTGTSFHKADTGSAVVRVFDAKDFRHVKSIDFGSRSAVRLTWPRELNQLIVGTGSGEVVMLYSPFSSKKGALHFVGKHARTKPEVQIEGTSMGPIFNMTDREDIKRFYDTGHGNMPRIRRQEARHSQKTLKPDLPPSAEGGSVGTSDSMAFAALALKMGAQRLHLQSASGQEPDSQKALLAYADKVEKKPSLIGSAYSKSQPEKLLDWSEDVSEGDKRMQEVMKGDFCRKCGHNRTDGHMATPLKPAAASVVLSPMPTYVMA